MDSYLESLVLHDRGDVYCSPPATELGRLPSSVVDSLKLCLLDFDYATFYNRQHDLEALEKQFPALIKVSAMFRSCVEDQFIEQRMGLFKNTTEQKQNGDFFHIESDTGLTEIIPIEISILAIGPTTKVLEGNVKRRNSGSIEVVAADSNCKIRELEEGCAYRLDPVTAHAEPSAGQQIINRFFWRHLKLLQ